MVFEKYSSKSFKTDQTVRANHSTHPTPRFLYHQFLQFPSSPFLISLNYHLLSPAPPFRRRVLSVHQGHLHDWTLHLFAPNLVSSIICSLPGDSGKRETESLTNFYFKKIKSSLILMFTPFSDYHLISLCFITGLLKFTASAYYLH